MDRSDEHSLPGILVRLGFEPQRESDAFALLARGDTAGCRRALWRLARELHAPAGEEDGRPYSQLLHDILQKLNRRMHRAADLDRSSLETRMRLIAEFSAAANAAEARAVFRRELRRIAGGGVRPASRSRRLADRAREYIDSNFERRTSLSSVAEHLNVSANYLSRVFRRETGRTLTSYIQHVRIGHARRLLADGRESISEIAYRVGYRNYRDFYRNFVRQENASPREVRERLTRAG